jgi:hypothetical protein
LPFFFTRQYGVIRSMLVDRLLALLRMYETRGRGEIGKQPLPGTRTALAPTMHVHDTQQGIETTSHNYYMPKQLNRPTRFNFFKTRAT